MFDVGFTEIVLIGIVSLVVIGPERLPAVARTAGQWVGKMQRFVKGVKTDLASELQTGDLKKLIGDQREQIDELRNMVSTAKKDFQSTTRSVVNTTRESLAELETTVNDAKVEIAKAAEETDTPADVTLAKPADKQPALIVDSTGAEISRTDSSIDSSTPGTSNSSTTADAKIADTTIADAKIADTTIADAKIADTTISDTTISDTAPTARTETKDSDN